MNADQPTDPAEGSVPSFDELFPLPAGIKLRTRRFGTAGPSRLTEVPPLAGDAAEEHARPRRPFVIDWRDDSLGLRVRIREQADGELIAHVACTDARRIGQAVSVALVGTVEEHMIRKTIPLDIHDAADCRGEANFGPLANATQELGKHLGILAFILE